MVASERWLERVQPDGDCLLWSFGNNSGYGSLLLDGHRVQAHRVAYVAATGKDIPVGMILDHVQSRGCISRRCVNPEHLEVVTHSTNTRRSTIHNQRMRDRTHCPQGHALTPDNLLPYYLKRGVRACKTCHADRARANRSRAKGS
jgi:hypothetical protein